MKLNDMLYNLLDLAKEESEPNRHAHSEEYNKLYDELDTKTLIIDELEEQVECPLDIVFKALTNGDYYGENADWMSWSAVDLHQNLEGDYVLYTFDEQCLFTKDYKKTWWLKEDRNE